MPDLPPQPDDQRTEGKGDDKHGAGVHGRNDAGNYTVMSGPKVFSLEEVAAHNSAKDCWIAVDGKVYDVTKFLDSHPGEC